LVSADAGPTPLTILGSKLKLWLRSDLGVTEGASDDVDEWADQSGNSNDVVKGSVAFKRVDSVTDGRPAIRGVGTANSRLHLTNGFTGIAIGDRPVLYVVQAITATEAQVTGVFSLATTESSNQGIQVYGFSDGNLYADFWLGAGTLSTPSYNHAVPSAIALYRFDVTSSFEGRIAVNNAVVGSLGAARASGMATAPNDLQIGAVYGVASAARADMFEYILTNAALSAGEETDLLTYVADRYPSIGL
jgi:hypothetical protein